MTGVLLHNARILASDVPGWLLIENRQIAQIGQETPPAVDAERLDCQGRAVLPGFIDLHVHGAVGHDTMDASPDGLVAMARFYATRGVTSFLPTTMTSPGDKTMRALECAAELTGPVDNGATILGAHLEGPYLNVIMKGAQDGQYVRLADPAEYRAWLEVDVIRQVTVAPEFAPNQAFMRECAARGINISLGHTQASYEEVQQAVALGARQATHTFNAMTGVHHRKPGTAGAVLTLDTITCELIADTVHVHPAILKLTVRAKGADKVVLVTDAIMGAGMPDGLYELGGQMVSVANGTATLSDGTLAGSVLTMDVALRNILAATGLPLSEAWPMTSANAARQIGVDDHKGRLAAGYDADIIVLDEQNNVALTIVEGRIVYRA